MEGNFYSLQNKYLNPPDGSPYDPSSFPNGNSIYQAALEAGDFKRALEYPNHRNLPEAELKKIMGDVLEEITELEVAAREPNRRQVPYEVAKRVKRIIRFSAPGTYYHPVKPDRYENLPWAKNMDRLADDDAACLAIELAGVLSGKDFSVFKDVILLDGLNPVLNGLRDQVRQAITDSGIRLVYFGRPDEAEAIQKVIDRKGSFVPPSSVDVISISDPSGNDNDVNTISQVTALKKYYQSANPADEIAVLCDFAPRLVRQARIIAQHAALPQGTTLAVLPLATPTAGEEILRELEARGAVAYALRGDAVIESSLPKPIHRQ